MDRQNGSGNVAHESAPMEKDILSFLTGDNVSLQWTTVYMLQIFVIRAYSYTSIPVCNMPSLVCRDECVYIVSVHESARGLLSSEITGVLKRFIVANAMTRASTKAACPKGLIKKFLKTSRAQKILGAELHMQHPSWIRKPEVRSWSLGKCIQGPSL